MNHEPSPLSRRSASPAIKSEPQDFFENIRGSRGDDAIWIDLTAQDDGEEVESLLLRHTIPSNTDALTAPPLETTTITWTRRLRRFATRLVLPVMVIWLGIMGVARVMSYLKEYGTPHADLPLDYIAWSVGSNAVHARDVMQHMLPIRQIGRTLFNKAEYVFSYTRPLAYETWA